VTWWAIIAVGLGTLAMRAAGPVLVGHIRLREDVQRILVLAAVALLGALIAISTFVKDGHLQVDARAAGVGVAAVLLWRRAPFPVVVIAAAVTAALIRALP
jgi:branched-subunit amino acid transport protein